MESSNTDGTSENTNKQDSLINYKEVKETPFTIVTIGEESFGALGDKRITEVHHNIEELEDELRKITWDRLMQVIWITTDKLMELRGLKGLGNE